MEPQHDAILKRLDEGLTVIKEDLAKQIQKRDETLEQTGKASADALAAITKLNTDWEEAKTAQEDRIAEIKKQLDAFDAAGGRSLGGRQAIKTAGQQFVESEEYKSGVQHVKERLIRNVPINAHRKDVFDGGGMGNTDVHLFQSQYLPLVIPPQRDLHLRDILNVGQASSASIEYLQQATGPWVAGIQEEGATGEPAQQPQKLEQTPSFNHVAETAKTIAHWVHVTEQIVQDAGWLRQWIDQSLVRGLLLAEDVQFLYGTGLNGQVTGLMVDPLVQEFDYGDTGSGDDDTPADTLRRAITRLQIEYYSPSAAVLHPLDWESIELTKDGEERYIWFFGPQGINQPPTVWRLPVVVTPAIQAGEYLLGDFQLGASIYDHLTPRISAGYINDDFIRNQIVVRAEERLLFVRPFPRAFVRGELTSS